MDIEIKGSQPQAFVGVAFSDKIIFNILDEDVSFFNSGLSIIAQIKHDKNNFVAKIIESQSYNSIKCIFDDKIVFSDFYDLRNENRESFKEIMNLIQHNEVYQYFYILDLDSDLLLIKIPEISLMYALDYNNSEDIRKYINTIKKED